MKKSHKRQFSLLLALSVLASTISVPVSAVTGTDETLHTHDDTPAVMDTAEPSAADDTADVPAASDSTASIATRTASEPITFTVEGSNTTYTLNANDIDLNVDAAAVSVGEETTVDMDNPNMIVIEAELKNIKVLNDDGETVALTDEQIQTVLGMYQQYLNYWAEHADVLGVQMPFFLQYNDNGEDGLGVLGEMLILAGKTVDDVRSGAYTYDELTGTIQTFMMGDQFGVNFYHDAIVSARNEVLTLIENSGAQTEAQKLLILNDWLAQVDSFDMPYIMNSGKEPGVDAGTMVAEEPTNHKYYQYVYDEIYKQYEAQLQTTFEQQIEDGFIAQLTQQVYEAAIEQIIYEQAYNSYIEENHEHTATATFTWAAPAEDGDGVPTATVEVICELCNEENQKIYSGDATVTLDEEASTAADCKEMTNGENVYVASVKVTDADKGIDTTITAEETYKVTVLPEHDFNENNVCTVCGATDDDHEHSYDAVFTWSDEKNEEGSYTATADVFCETCNEVVADDLEADVDAAVTAATCETDGEVTYTAKATITRGDETLSFTDNTKKTEVIPATGHDWEMDADSCTWNKNEETGEWTAVADFRCVNTGCENTVTDKTADSVEIDADKSTDSTCAVKGVTAYKATFTVEEETFTAEQTVEKELAAHTASENAIFSWEEAATGGYTATAVVNCEICGNAMTEPVNAVVSRSEYTEPTCGTEGKNVYTATATITVDGTKKVFTEQKVDNIAATGEHTYNDNGVCSVCKATNETHEHTYDETTGLCECGAEKPSEEDNGEAALVDMMDGEETEEKTQLEKDADAYATQVADQYMEANKEAISEDAHGFVVANFGEQVADYIDTQVEATIETARTEGVEVDPVNAPGYKMTIDQIVEQQMNTPMADLPQKYDENGNPVVDENGNPVHMTPNEAVPVYAQQAATQLTGAVINYWEGTQFGALGDGKSVCLGYAKAFAYLVQCMHPEIYTTDGDIDNPESWKTAKELYYTDGALDITKNYSVDLVRVTFDASATMFGETQDNFNSDHFWNAVQIDGQWYYVDPCYTDVFTEVMVRDRVETDGSMSHLYFMFSHQAAVDMYDGNYKEIKTLYETAASDTSYEDSWMSRIVSNTYFADGYAYYVYDSTDMLTMLEESESENSDYSTEITYKLVRHKLDATDTDKNGDEDFETLIFFNSEDEDGNVMSVVYDTDGYELKNGYDFVTELYAEHTAYEDIYPSLGLTAALYENKIYFNLSNCILVYDLTADPASETIVSVVKEYNTVHGLRDKTNAFGGMAFSVVDSAEKATFTVENHPIAGLTVKNDGNLYVSIATNFAYVSGNESQTGYGYAYEESNYNSEYSTYGSDYSDSELEQFGFERDTNDNDEFMWSANFVETLAMSHFAGTGHTYEAVSVDAFCEQDAFTENRCTTCGAIEAGSRVTEEGTAHEHHYVKFDETYYTKNDDGVTNTGFCYVCTECSAHISEPDEPADENSMYYQYSDTTYEEEVARYEAEMEVYEAVKASAGHKYVPTDATWADDYSSVSFTTLECVCEDCHDRNATLDVLVNAPKGNALTVTFSTPVEAEASIISYNGECTTGVNTVYGASGTASNTYGDYPFTVETEVKGEAGQHVYAGEFTWTETTDEEGNVTGYTATVGTLVCQNENCGDEHEADAVNVERSADSYKATCTEDGADIYVATATVYAEDGETVIGTAADTKEVVLPATGHDWGEEVCNNCGIEKPDYTVSGTVKSYVANYEANTETVTIELCDAEGNVLDTRTGVGEEVTFEGFLIEEGTYTVVISKKNHVTRTYEVTASGDEQFALTVEAEINPVGDADQDGEISVGDYNAIYNHLMVEGKEMTDSYALLCADAEPDGEISVGDYNAIYNHLMVSGKELW